MSSTRNDTSSAKSDPTDTRPHLVIIGNGMAAGRLLDNIRQRDASKFNISVIGDEKAGSYNRIMLSSVLAGEVEADSIIQKNPQWYEQQQVRFIGGVFAERIDTVQQQVLLANGETLHYDHCVITTGSRPAKIPAGNQALANIFSFRTLDDVDTITRSASKARKALVVGGGLLGLEAAYGLAQKELEVHLVHRSPWLLNRQLDETSGRLLQRVMLDKGVHCHLGCEVENFIGEHALSAAQLNNGERIDCDLAVIATGITPNIDLAKNSGLECARGILVNEHLQTSATNISALGECCEIDAQTFGLVEPIWHQCENLAEQLCFGHSKPFVNPAVATKLKVSGVQVFSAGEFITQAHHRAVTVHADKKGVYRKLLFDGERLVGAVLFGDTRGGNEYFEAILNNTSSAEPFYKTSVNTQALPANLHRPVTAITA